MGANDHPSWVNSVYVTTEAFMIALSERMAGVMPDTTINKSILWSPEETALRRRAEVLEVASRDGGDKAINPADYELDFVSVFTPSMNVAWERQRSAVAINGIKVTYDNDKTVMHRAVPIDLQFDIVYWSKYKQNIDRFLQELAFWHFENPTLRIFLEGDIEVPFKFLIKPDMRDGGTVARMYDDGKYWQLKSSILVESWIFKDLAVHTAKTIVIDMYSGMEAVDVAKVFHSEITEA